MKARSLFIAVLCSFMGVVNTYAQDWFNETTPESLQGVWQMCFYSSSLPALPGELKSSNSLKILGEGGEFTNVVMMPTGAIIIGSGTYTLNSDSTFTEHVKKNIHLPELDGKDNVMHFELAENGKLMFVKFKSSEAGDDVWSHEIWRKIDMPSTYPTDIVR